ncbi:MAG: succinylglutamate desuccinylase/aspartoacylase family protein [Planctomycetes bacterium]|nr:succinylglutamate desuccinylase/aspartoacylase family protein [Planctomycetota bacterium]
MTTGRFASSLVRRSAAVLVLALAACRSEPVESPPPPPVRVVLGTSVEGRPIDALRHGPDVPGGVLVLASIHGSEPAGTPLLRELERAIARRPESFAREPITLVPIANPDGYARRVRTNARGIDLNRNFPAGNFETSVRNGDGPLSEPESRALERFIVTHRPRLIVSIHQPLSCIDWDGPAEAIVERAAGLGALPAKRLGGRPGSLGSWAGAQLGVPVITLELRAGDELLSSGALFERYGATLFALLSLDPPSE